MGNSGFIPFFTMFNSLGVVTLVVFLVSDTKAQVTVSQPPSVSTAPGGNVEIYCTVRGVSLGNADIDWYQQKSEDAPPRYILHHNSQTVSRGSSTPGRFSGKSDSSTNTRCLTISQVQAEDEANYHCAVWVGSISTYVFGTGTKLTILTQELSSPSVSLLPPASKQITEGKMATLVCLVNNFFPGSVEVSWSTDGKVVETGIQTTRTVRDSGNTYSLSSYLTLTASEWNSHEEYTCGVTHESLGSQLKRSIQRSGCE
ncbi:immunoglobulin lambda-1 light chain-like [Pristis pectinata]|uniref:immunoglobulin lambda-1 light chain-like n=1 Tax=Pristis pectinata TaxID=685728 RepID=UPI00223E2BCE|nr:immunoglobulin lambda-1 light chain-like [Pristis pectinata]